MASFQVVKVLIVDDDIITRRIYKTMLSRFGFEIIEAEDAKKAINQILDGNEYDLVLIDKEMSNMDGVEAIRTLRGMGISTKFVAITADANSMGAFVDAGVDKFLLKPLNLHMLTDILNAFNFLD
ncbi:Chemotaxis protein CheY [Rhynchospora pubera]|uniref:Chemotaxis protein CheY n=1 Tax=Rhynchospora pubera TaxID=906938 RepID=A0AAV8FFK5_9POAL|nr:Chemotaxis protein CheY [Rhynchospora pubera]